MNLFPIIFSSSPLPLLISLYSLLLRYKNWLSILGHLNACVSVMFLQRFCFLLLFNVFRVSLHLLSLHSTCSFVFFLFFFFLLGQRGDAKLANFFPLILSFCFLKRYCCCFYGPRNLIKT